MVVANLRSLAHYHFCVLAPANCVERYEALVSRNVVGVHIPKCEVDGTYNVVQCHGSTGFCWCAHWKTGEAINGTERSASDGPLDCSQFSRGQYSQQEDSNVFCFLQSLALFDLCPVVQQSRI